MKVLAIFFHLREDSMTGQIKDNFEKGLKEAEHEVDTLDLYKIVWSPALPQEDEPDYNSKGNQHYSEEVKSEQSMSAMQSHFEEQGQKDFVATCSADDMRENKFGGLLEYSLNVGVADYCKIESSKVVSFYDIMIPTEEEVQSSRDKAYKEGLNFGNP